MPDTVTSLRSSPVPIKFLSFNDYRKLENILSTEIVYVSLEFETMPKEKFTAILVDGKETWGRVYAINYFELIQACKNENIPYEESK